MNSFCFYSVAFALLAAACGGSAPDSAASSSSNIVGGTEDDADTAVVLLRIDQSNGHPQICTGAFITSNVVLTAAHCVSDAGGPVWADAQFTLDFGTDAYSSPTQAINVPPEKIHVTDAWANPQTTYSNGTPKNNYGDVAVLVVQAPQGVTPIPINTQALPSLDSSDPNQTVHISGYGTTDSGFNTAHPTVAPGSFGIKNALDAQLEAINDTTLVIGTTGAQGCKGDSGGPAIRTSDNTVIGIDSYDINGCANGEYYQRIDIYASFIQQWTTGSGADNTSSNAAQNNSENYSQ